LTQPALDKAKLVELLAQAHEHEGLDYKSHVDLQDRRAELELIKDIAAFSASGGYLIIGADDGGRPTATMSEQDALQFDESRIRAKVRRYLPEPLEIRTARHDLDGALLVLLYIGAHPDGFLIVMVDGQTGDRVIFRRGDVFVRHGTASERWQQHDFGQMKEALIKRHLGVPELVPAPPSTYRVEAPRLIHTGGGEALYQRLLIEVENVGASSAYIIETTATGYDPGGALGSVRPPAAIPPNYSRPFELNARVADDGGLDAGTEIALRVGYEGGGRRRNLSMSVRYNRAGGFENLAHS
jgi:hypothetical protein